MSPDSLDRTSPPETSAAGYAHVATCSFLASRAVPAGGFGVALAGGVALARAAARHGWRWGYGASGAATLEATAVLGPARFGVPLTQALTAPMLGSLERRGTPAAVQVVPCAAVRLLQNASFTAFYIWIVVGGLDAYAGTFDSLLAWLPGLPEGVEGALLLTAAGLLGWAAFASVVQVLVYRRGLRRWAGDAAASAPAAVAANRSDTPPPAGEPGSPGFDPRALALAAVIAFALLVSGTSWPLLSAVAAWLGLAWVVARPEREAVAAGAGLALLLGAGALAFGVVGGVGLDVALRRAARAALLVLVATWLRGAARADGLREVFRRVLARVRGLPAAREAGLSLDRLGSTAELVASGRGLINALRGVPKRPLAVVDAVLAWVAGEATRYRGTASGPIALSVRARDAALVALAAAPALAVAWG